MSRPTSTEPSAAAAPRPLAVSGYANGARSESTNCTAGSCGTVTRNCRGAQGGLSAGIHQQLHSLVIIIIIDNNQESTHENKTRSAKNEVWSYVD